MSHDDVLDRLADENHHQQELENIENGVGEPVESSSGHEEKEGNEEGDLWPHSKIRFDVGVTVFEVRARSLIPLTEKRSIWYQPSDFAKISSLNRSAVKVLRENPDDPDHCGRGLEHKLYGDSDRINDIKVNSIFSVLKEQSRQRKSNVKDEAKIAKIYKEHVFSSAKTALEKGLNDEKSARQEEKPKMKQRRSGAAFDDFDLKELQDLDLHDDMDRFEWRMSDVTQPTEIYEMRKDRKESKTKLRRENRRSLSPMPGPKDSTRGRSSKSGKDSDQDEQTKTSLPRVLSGKLSSFMRGSSSKSPKPSREKSPKPTSGLSFQRRGSKRTTELPLPGRRNPPASSKLEKTGLRKIRSDMF